MIEGLLVDFYGIFVHEDDAIIAEICAEMVAASPAPLDDRDVAAFWWKAFAGECGSSHGHSFRTQRDIERSFIATTLREFEIQLDPDPLSERLFGYWHSPVLFDDALEFLTALAIPICIISNIDSSDLESAVLQHRLESTMW